MKQKRTIWKIQIQDWPEEIRLTKKGAIDYVAQTMERFDGFKLSVTVKKTTEVYDL